MQLSYPGFQLRRKLGLKLAHSTISIIPLYEDFGSNCSLLPNGMQTMSL